MKKLFLLLFCAICSLQMSAQFSGSGSGTSSDPYLIFNANQLNQVRNYLNTSGVYFKMMDDIDLKDWLADNNPTQGWQPIGISSSPFKGIFDGNGHKITNFFITRTSTDYVGFFGCTTSATISNLEIDGTIKGNNYTGGLIGTCTSTTVSSCSLNGDVTGGERTGGMFGNISSSSIKNSNKAGNVTSSGNYAGGFSGSCTSATITDCKSTGDVSGSGYVGGFVGEDNGSTYTNCDDSGDLKSGDYAGGFIGDCIGAVNCTNCFVKNIIGGNTYVGGFIGSVSSGNVSMTSCGTIMTITSTSGYVGGLVGKMHLSDFEACEINNCYAIGDITANRDDVGGLIGYMDTNSNISGTTYRHALNPFNFSVSNSYYSGRINAKNCVGGIMGYVSGGTFIYIYHDDRDHTYSTYATVTINKCYSKSTLKGDSIVGGIVGKCGSYVTLQSNAAIEDEINASVGSIGRIYAVNGSSTNTFGANGSSSENKALVAMKVTSNGVVKSINDNLQDGTSVGTATLKLKATYQGIGWDFTNDWAIQETECLPYKVGQTAPPVIESVTSAGMTTISGKSIDGGDVTVIVGGKTYTTASSANKWSVTTDEMQAGDLISVSAKAENKEQSYFVTQYVGFTGSGTKADPYLVYTAADLQGINSRSYYKLMNDIDLTSWISKHSATTGWIPIGRNSALMKYFDGNNHKITGLWINGAEDYTGLFANGSNDTIVNLSVVVAEGKSIKGGNYTGILIGKNQYGMLYNCSASGDVSGTANVGGLMGQSVCDSIVKCVVKGNVISSGNSGGYIGGITGNSSSYITNTSYSGAVTTSNTSSYAGGLVGYSTKEIALSYSTGSVTNTGTSSYAGGIVGENHSSIINCYSTMAVSSTNYAAGIAGYNWGIVNKCYSSGDIKCSNIGAGVVGYNDNTTAKTSYCLAANNIIDVSDAKGIAMRVLGGYKNGASDPEKNNFALKTMAVSINNVPQNILDDLLNGIAKTADETKMKSTYELLGWDMVNVWDINSGIGYPYLRSNAAVTDTTGTGNHNTNPGGGGTVGKDSTVYNTFAMNDTTSIPGGQIKLPILLNNRDSITAFQFDLYLPKGVSLATDDNGYKLELGNRMPSPTKYMLSSAKQPDGAIRIIGLSMSSTTFTDHTGPALYITINVADTLVDGEYTLLIKNMTLTTNKAVEYDVDQTKSTLTISSFRLGDVDNNGSIKITDAVAIINHLLGSDNGTFIFKAADIDANNKINITDAVLLINKFILNVSGSSVKAFGNTFAASGTADMEAKPFTIAAGEEKTVDIELNNPSDAITAFQFDMNLPEGFSLVKDADGSYCRLAAERGMTTTHQMGSNVLPNGDLRVACFSANNSTIAGTSGTVATLRIKADATVAAGTYYLTLHDAVLAHADGMNSITPAETKTAINVGATGITGTTNNGLQISTGKGTITVKATTTQTVQIVSTNGALIANRTVQAGETVTINATAGVYIVNGIKMIVK